jgi:hypothetical protein
MKQQGLVAGLTFHRQFTPGPRGCGYFKAASRNACRRYGGSPAQLTWLYAAELDEFRLCAIERPSLRQEVEAALEVGTRLKKWKKKLVDCLSSAWMRERGLMTWKVLSERPEVAVPKSILRGIVNQCIEMVFSGDSQNSLRCNQLGDDDIQILDRKHRQAQLEGLFADFEQALASVDQVDAAIFRYHLEGYSFREIEDKVGVSSSNAQRRHEEIRLILASRLRDYRK